MRLRNLNSQIAGSRPGLRQFLIHPVLPRARVRVLGRIAVLQKEDKKCLIVSPG